jgi:hypothetical protein
LNTEKQILRSLRRDGVFARHDTKRVCAANLIERLRSGSYVSLFIAGAAGVRGEWFLLMILADVKRESASFRPGLENQRPGVMIQKLPRVRVPLGTQHTWPIARTGTLCSVLWTCGSASACKSCEGRRS